MKTCKRCGFEKEIKEFYVDEFDEPLDICIECVDEDEMEREEQEGWRDIAEHYSDR